MGSLPRSRCFIAGNANKVRCEQAVKGRKTRLWKGLASRVRFGRARHKPSLGSRLIPRAYAANTRNNSIKRETNATSLSRLAEFTPLTSRPDFAPKEFNCEFCDNYGCTENKGASATLISADGPVASAEAFEQGLWKRPRHSKFFQFNLGQSGQINKSSSQHIMIKAVIANFVRPFRDP